MVREKPKRLKNTVFPQTILPKYSTNQFWKLKYRSQTKWIFQKYQKSFFPHLIMRMLPLITKPRVWLKNPECQLYYPNSDYIVLFIRMHNKNGQFKQLRMIKMMTVATKLNWLRYPLQEDSNFLIQNQFMRLNISGCQRLQWKN